LYVKEKAYSRCGSLLNGGFCVFHVCERVCLDRHDTCVQNQGAYLTNACVKLNTQNYFKVNIQPDKNVSDAWSQGTELIYARARDTNNVYASSLVETRYAGKFTPLYYSGYGVFGYSYKCAAQYADSNPYQYAALTLNWEP